MGFDPLGAALYKSSLGLNGRLQQLRRLPPSTKTLRASPIINREKNTCQ
jgi:hypothetical protein